MKHDLTSRPRRMRAFTLIELMIAIAVIGLLAAIAYPIYLDKVRTARRVDAKSLLLRAANREEQIYTTGNQYVSGMDALGLAAHGEVVTTTDNGAYSVTATASLPDQQHYTIHAQAIGDQIHDACTSLSIDDRGQKNASDAGCW